MSVSGKQLAVDSKQWAVGSKQYFIICLLSTGYCLLFSKRGTP